MKKCITISTLLVIIYGSVSNAWATKIPLFVEEYHYATAEKVVATSKTLKRAIWVGGSERPSLTIGGGDVTGSANVKSINADTDQIVISPRVKVYKAGITDAVGNGGATCNFNWRIGTSGGYTTVAMTYKDDVDSNANDRFEGEITLDLTPTGNYVYYFDCTAGGETGYDSNSGANYTWNKTDLDELTNSDHDVCNFVGDAWLSNHPEYRLHASMRSDWFGAGNVTTQTIQGTHNYAQVTLQAQNAGQALVFRKGSDANKRWDYDNIALNTALTAGFVNSGANDSSINTAAVTNHYYTYRFRRTDASSSNVDAEANRDFSVMKTENAPIRIASMTANGVRETTEKVDHTANARIPLLDRGITCAGSASYMGAANFPIIGKDQGIAISGTYTGTIGTDQFIYVRYIGYGHSLDKVVQCTASAGNYTCAIPQADIQATSASDILFSYYIFTSSVDFTTTGAGAVTASTACKGATPTTGCTVTSANNLDILSLDFWNYQIAAATAAKRLDPALGEKFRRTPNRNYAFGVSPSLPVSLTALTAAVTADEANLQWTTVSETNNLGFYVEHRQGNGAWKQLGFVSAQGSPNTTHTYTYPVKGLSYGYNTFRLKQVDNGGQGQYSKEITVLVELPGTALLNAAYPNPFAQTSTLEFAVAAKQNVRVELFNILGQKVQTLFNGTLEDNVVTTATVNAASLANGTYIVRMTGDNFVKTQNVVVVK
jgi:Secretion system C-terminal sorting domain